LIEGKPIRSRTAGFVESMEPRLRQLRLNLHLLSRNGLTRSALIILLLLIVVAALAPYIAPHPEAISGSGNLTDRLKPPSAKYLFGTDELGRDIFSRVLYGTRLSVGAAVLAVGLALLIGVPLGAVAGAIGGWVDDVIMRVTDVFISFPSLVLALAIAAFVGPSLRTAITAVAISWWPWYTRLIRGTAISLRERQFVRAARAIGSPPSRIVLKHILPNSMGPVIVQASLDLGGVILMISALSFLGLGAQPPTPEWGLMVSTSRAYFMTAWWYIIFPGLAIVFAVLSFNLLGDGLREIFDPRNRRY